MIGSGTNRVRRVVGRVRRSFWRRSLILLYHRVEDVRPDPWGLAVSPANFRDHLEVIREYGTALSLTELVESLKVGKVPRNGIVLTFDDGYADNLFNAKPLLEESEIPASIFIATSYLDGRLETWWDALDKIWLQPNSLPQELTLKFRGDSHCWNLADATVYTEDDARRASGWKAKEEPPGPRQQIYLALRELMHPLPELERRKMLEHLHEWSRIAPEVRSTHRFLSPDELHALADGELIEIGAHSVSHSALAMLSPSEQRKEVRSSKAALEDLLNRPVRNFAYPYGGPSDFSLETVAAVRDAGFDCACSTTRKWVGARSDPYSLPRVYAPNCDANEFDRFLFDWFNG